MMSGIKVLEASQLLPKALAGRQSQKLEAGIESRYSSTGQADCLLFNLLSFGLHSILKRISFINLKGSYRRRERQRERLSIHGFIPQVATMARVGPG